MNRTPLLPGTRIGYLDMTATVILDDGSNMLKVFSDESQAEVYWDWVVVDEYGHTKECFVLPVEESPNANVSKLLSNEWFNKLKPFAGREPIKPKPEDWGVYPNANGIYLWTNPVNHLHYMQDIVRYQQTYIQMLREALQWYVDNDEVVESMPENEFWIAGKYTAKELLGEDYILNIS